MAAENQNQAPNQDDIENEKLLEILRESIGPEMDSVKKTIEQVDRRATSVEDFQLSSLILDKLVNDEKYKNERDRFFEDLARRSNIDLSEDAVNKGSQFETAFGIMSNTPKETLKEVAPEAFKDLYEEIEKQFPIQRSRKMLMDAGVSYKLSEEVWDDLARSNQLAYVFNEKFGDTHIDYEAALRQTAPQINKAFSSMSLANAKKFGMLAVATIASGGTNVAIKAGIFGIQKAISSETLRNTISKGVSGFDSFLQKRGVDTTPLHEAKNAIKERSKKIGEKLEGTKWGKMLVKGTAVGALVAGGLAIGDFDLDAIGKGLSEFAVAAKDATVDLANGAHESISYTIFQGQMLANEVGGEFAAAAQELGGKAAELAGAAGDALANTEAGGFVVDSAEKVKTVAGDAFDAAKENGAGLVDAVSESFEKGSGTGFEGGRVMPDTSELTSSGEVPAEPDVNADQDTGLSPEEMNVSDIRNLIQANVDIPFQEMIDGLSEDQLKSFAEENQAFWDKFIEEKYGDNIPEGIPATMPLDYAQELASNVAYAFVEEGYSSDITIRDIHEGSNGPTISTGSFGDWSGTSTPEPEAPVNTAPPEDQVAPTKMEAPEPKVEEPAVRATGPMFETPNEPISQGSAPAPESSNEKGQYMDPRDNMAELARQEEAQALAQKHDEYLVNLNETTTYTNEVKVESGSSIYSAVKEHLTAVNGMPPSEQAVMQASADILAEHGLEPESVPAGFTFEFNHEDYAYVDKVSQATVDLARLGPNGIPASMQDLTIAEIASGKFENTGPVDTRMTGQMMTEAALSADVRADLQNAINKGLDPNTSMAGYFAVLESKAALLDPKAEHLAKGTSALKEVASGINQVNIPDGHAAPTASAGNPHAFDHIQERQKLYRSEYGLGQ